jgi:osmotically inducible lipoprotein OsmB
MKTTMNTLKIGALALLVALGTTGCGSMSYRDQATTLGAVAGAAAGSALTTGSPGGIVAGALIGGVAGDQIGKNRERER